MDVLKSLLRRVKAAAGAFADPSLLPQSTGPDCSTRLLSEQMRFILWQLRHLNETLRYALLKDAELAAREQVQTLASFDYQWSDFCHGRSLPDDAEFMDHVRDLLCRMTHLPAEWFREKLVIDLGCGGGRFTLGLLSLGAVVTARDCSRAGLQRAAELCKTFAPRLKLEHSDILADDAVENFDLCLCFGVVHHTGNTYLAVRNAARKVKSGGRLFLMVYGVPETYADFVEVNSYEVMREQLQGQSFEERKQTLIRKFGLKNAHGWFDAVSPRINDLLTFSEIAHLLEQMGYVNVKRTMPGRNHHIVADRK